MALGCLVFLGLIFVCETPRFLESKERSNEALQVLTRLRGGEERQGCIQLGGWGGRKHLLEPVAKL